ncbi:MAG: hypothetical protein MJZ40_00695 [Bacteroidaceae bacterium]|nr:hypothetical protein [Bacteroidaceae bacterium]
MIHIIIFSFNRAMQLDTLLRSIRLHWSSMPHKVSVLYNTTQETYQKAYEMLAAEYSYVEFIKETSRTQRYHSRDYFHPYNWLKLLRYPDVRRQKSNFRDLLIKSLRLSECSYTMFLTDDSAFFADVCLTKEQLAFIDENPSQNQISLRLGIDNVQKPNSINLADDGTLRWRFSKYRNARSWGYTFSVDAHIYSSSVIRNLLNRIIFCNPTTLEAHINDYTTKKKLLDRGMAFESPSILSFPINMVQQIADNESLGVSEALLNKFFLDGFQLVYEEPKIKSVFQVYPDNILLINPISGESKIIIAN